ncbi:MAG: M23 family metallopeptidase [Clostridia bacterium]|nr:M23 family metallopeptidase [Clostridia bacterium]
MNKFRDFINRHKVTIMVIPGAEKSIRQWKFNLSIAFVILVGLIVINISLLFGTVTSRVVAVNLSSENHELAENLLMTQDKINSLYNINSNSSEEIDKLKITLESSALFLKSRLDEMDKTQEYISQLVLIFNKETSSSLPVPTSRSFNRMDSIQTLGETEVDVNGDDLLFMEIDALITNDEIAEIISDQSEIYHELVSKLENQLTYLESRPDFYPTNGRLSSKFGYRRDPITGASKKHNGIDISNSVGTKIYSAGSGVVTFSGYSGAFGRVIIIDHGYGYESIYSHCSELLVNAGDTVSKADLIAKMGRTGRSTGSHLHFEIRYNGTPINPLNILK